MNFLPGLLAGLHEFPTVERILSARSDDSVHLHSLIMRYLKNGSQILESPKQSSAMPHLAKVHPVGDVVHVFSHIRKTYRVSWAVLAGPGGPPTLNAPGVQPASKKSTRAKKLASTSGNNPGGAVSPPANTACQWVKLSNVEHAKYVHRMDDVVGTASRLEDHAD